MTKFSGVIFNTHRRSVSDKMDTIIRNMDRVLEILTEEYVEKEIRADSYDL